MYDTSDIRKNLKFILDSVPVVVVEFQFVKPGKGQAFTRTKLRNMLTGTMLERTFKQGEKFEKADMEERQQQFLYPEGDKFVFMDTKSYDQLYLSGDQLGEARYFIQDGMMVDVLFWNERPIGVTPPTFVELKIVETEPGFKGDTANNVMKPAKCSTGVVVPVPIFINQGDWIRIDTRTGEYAERVAKTR